MSGTGSNQAEDGIRRVAGPSNDAPAPSYSIASLVTDVAQCAAMHQSFENNGFTSDGCEYLYVDNTGPQQTDAYRGLNALLNAARAPVLILCHQDVRLLKDGREELDARLDELTRHDPNWALAGNAGGVAPGVLAVRISDPHGKDVHVGQLPERVFALDENFIIVRRDSRIGFSKDLQGFHFYGADICLHAVQAGYTAYVIDFHLEHLSPGRKSQDFHKVELAFQEKWSRALSPRWLQTTCSLLRLSGAPGGTLVNRYAAKAFSKLARRLPGARGWSRSYQKSA